MSISSKYTTSLVILFAVLLLASCTGQFEDNNTDPYGVSDEELKEDNNYVGPHLVIMQQSIYFNYAMGERDWPFQVIQNLNADLYSGYMAAPSIFKTGGHDNQVYKMVEGWNSYAWNYAYTYLMSNSLEVSKKSKKYTEYYHFDAINKILKVVGMSRLSEQYGVVIYSQYGQRRVGGAYDSQDSLYTYFFRDLTSAVDSLNKKINSADANKTPFARYDMAYGGDYERWVKLGNTIRLRLAMRLVKYNADWARREGEAAIAAGVMEDNKDVFAPSGHNYSNPLAVISNSWKEACISANVESILSGYGDPRLSKLAVWSKSKGGIKGLRLGIPDLGTDVSKYQNACSQVNVTTGTAPILATAAEAKFLLAEAALRGWNTGDGSNSAQQFYEDGVNLSFDQMQVSGAETYLQSSTTPARYVDPVRDSLSINAVSTVTPKWSDALNDEERLEKIITQKWIAMFPDGINAWSELRRTGYPKIFPIAKNESEEPYIPTSLGPRRIPVSSSNEKKNNPEYRKSYTILLDGSDNANTRIFWDVDRNNF